MASIGPVLLMNGKCNINSSTNRQMRYDDWIKLIVQLQRFFSTSISDWLNTLFLLNKQQNSYYNSMEKSILGPTPFYKQRNLLIEEYLTNMNETSHLKVHQHGWLRGLLLTSNNDCQR